MIRLSPAGFAIGLVAMMIGSPALAADEDANVWLAATASADVSPKISLTLESQLRFTDDAARLGQTILRPSVGLKLDPTTTASLGYAWVHTDPVGPARSDEHRAWQQLAYRLAGDGKGITVTARSRLEQRWVEGAGDMGWRLRQQVRLTAPIGDKIRAVAWSEPFLALDTTTWGQRKGLDRWRNFVGGTVPVGRSLTLEPGYLNQWVMRPGRDRVNHAASLSLSAKI